MLQHYLYKICCKVNDLVYWGIHSTTNLSDGYMGSGVALAEAKKQYGEENFYKVIMAYCNTREKALELEKLVVAGEKGNCLNKISGGGGIKKLYTDTTMENVMQSDNVLEDILMNITGQYNVLGVKQLLNLDIRMEKIPTEKELRKTLEIYVKQQRLKKVGKNYSFPLTKI